MLSHLQISNFTLVETLELEWSGGLTVLTGETGAGKSILLDALSLVLGDRADADKVRHGAEKTDIQASFAVHTLPFVSNWLKEHELGDGEDCLIRRVVTAEGRSRAFINGQSVTLQQLKALGDMLVDLHGQHEHQSLLKPSTHLRLLDEFAQHRSLAKEVKRAFYYWHTTQSRLQDIKETSQEANARYQLLSYQVQELDELNVLEGEVERLENEQKTLENIDITRQHCQNILDICHEDETGIVSQLHTIKRLVAELSDKSEALSSIHELFDQALIQVQEAASDIEREQNSDTMDESRLPEIEARLSRIYDISRKHRVQAEQLHSLHQQFQEELNALKSGDDTIDELESQLKEHFDSYQKNANKLSQARKKSAAKLSKLINAKLGELAMAHAHVHVELAPEDRQPAANGNETVNFLISTAPGQTPKPLSKIASGGELSRISLAIQVITAQTSTIPTLIFDEVDVGIGGTTGDIVGRLLRELGEQGQVICVTHLAQVASKAHQHYRVEKTLTKTSVNSSLEKLDKEEKVLEIARMMGGAIDSEQSIAHAKEMLTHS